MLSPEHYPLPTPTAEGKREACSHALILEPVLSTRSHTVCEVTYPPPFLAVLAESVDFAAAAAFYFGESEAQALHDAAVDTFHSAQKIRYQDLHSIRLNPEMKRGIFVPHMVARTMVRVGIEELEEEVLPVIRWNRAAAASTASYSRALLLTCSPAEIQEPHVTYRGVDCPHEDLGFSSRLLQSLFPRSKLYL